MRLLAGSVIGVVLGIYLPVSTGDTLLAVRTLSGIVISVGSYALFPLLFFGLLIAIHELREDRSTLRVYGKSALIIVSTTAATVLVATLITLLLAPRRIPPIFQEAVVPAVPPLAELATSVFPSNLFLTFVNEGTFLLPIAAAALLIGLVMHKEGSAVLPAVDLVDSLARIFYRLNWWLLEAVSVGMIAVSAAWLLQLRSVSDLGLFGPLVWVVAGVAAFFVLIIYPLVVFLLGDRYSPFAWLYALVGPALLAFFSGNSYFSYGVLTRSAKENFGISREVAAPALSLGVLFAKAGSAMVISAAFITVLRSYTALEIGFFQVLWVMGAVFVFSFVLGRAPGATVIVGLSILSQAYGQGMDDIYLIILPALPILTGIAVVVDTASNALAAFLVSIWERKRRIVDPYDFV
jgi:Na+/H+-dicarboxylate symporter